MLIPAKIF